MKRKKGQWRISKFETMNKKQGKEIMLKLSFVVFLICSVIV